MLQFIAYGEELNFIHPPKPKDPKMRWDIEWSAKIRLKSTAMLPLMADESGGSARKAPSSKKAKKTADPVDEPRDDARSGATDSGSGSDSPVKEIGKSIRGLLGF
jgi:hypothetical protein